MKLRITGRDGRGEITELHERPAPELRGKEGPTRNKHYRNEQVAVWQKMEAMMQDGADTLVVCFIESSTEA